MITTEGKLHIKRYLAGWVPRIASSISFGVGGKPEEVGDTALQFETDRADIHLVSYDFVNNKLVFKATVPESYAGTIYEIGLYSHRKNNNTEYGSRILIDFDSVTERWYILGTGAEPTYTATNARVGTTTLELGAAASATTTARLEGIFLDMTGYSAADKFALAYQVVGNVSSLRFRLMTDATNYYEFDLGAPAAGYRVDSVTKGSATVTGTPAWEQINMAEVVLTATGGGTSTVRLDGLRIEDVDTPNPDYVMVSRELLATPYVKEAGRSQSIEFALDVSV